MKIKIAKYLSDFFVKNGIIDCFMVTGGGAMHLDDALGHQEGMRVIFNHHEQACSIGAEGYARISNRIPLVCVTSGPGGTNAITGVMGAWLDSIPMFVVSGQVKRETTTWSCQEIGLRQLGDQEFDIVHSVANMTKYCVMVTEPEEIAFHLEKALYLALHGRKGPVWIDIPLDVQGAMIETDELSHFVPSKEEMVKGFSKQTVETVLNMIENANSPLILAGTGIRNGNAEGAFLELTRKLQIPVVTAWDANDVLAYDNPYYAGMPGTVGTRPGNFAVQNCDLLVSFGCRMNIRMIGYNKFDFAKNAYKIVVDIDPKELIKPTIKVDLPINADVKDLINAMLDSNYQVQKKHQKWLKWCKDVLYKYPAVLDSYHDTELINPYVFIDHLFEKLNCKDRIVCGNGSACVITFQAAKVKQGQRMFTNSGCAAMGYGLPAAVGVAVENNSERIVCIDGDGSVMMNIQELATIAHNNLNIKLFILNNNGYHSIRQTQTNLFKPPFIGVDKESGISFPNFEKLADAFGLKYFSFFNEKSADQVIKEVLNSDGPCVCEVIVDPTQFFAPKSSSKVLPDGRIVSPSLDDMAPFLDREEYEGVRFQK